MGLRVNTNIASLTAQRHMSVVTNRLQGNYSRLASGLRIASAADDAAGLAISEKMRSQIRSYTVASRNAQDGISLAQSAEGALGEVSNILGRMRELAMQSSNGTLSDEDRTTVDAEFQAMISEIDRISSQAQFNDINLLDGSATTLSMQIGLNSGESIILNLADLRPDNASGLNLTVSGNALDVSTSANAEIALGRLDAAITYTNSSRGDLGAQQNRMESSLRSIQSAKENLSAAESRIRDVDVASESADLTRNSIMQQASVSILQQANTQPQIALSLLQG
ncbi:MAG: flagellin FliC [Planctomycetes bacterium]|nr:flagellin FliC [Planctomycetota bacterium]MCB9909964.1 flagellin FliC [Planctomycetota bacterium]HPF13671.1 flagellin [Planctomycetota bacterium]